MNNRLIESYKKLYLYAQAEHGQKLAQELARVEREIRSTADSLASHNHIREANGLMAALPAEIAGVKAAWATRWDAKLEELRAMLKRDGATIRSKHAAIRDGVLEKLYPPISENVAHVTKAALDAARSSADVLQLFEDARAAGNLERIAYLEQHAEPIIEQLAQPGAHHDIELVEWRSRVEASRKERGGPELQQIEDDERMISEAEQYANQYRTNAEVQHLAGLFKLKPEFIPSAPAPEPTQAGG